MSNCRYTFDHDWHYGDQSMWCTTCWLVKPLGGKNQRSQAAWLVGRPRPDARKSPKNRIYSDPSSTVRRLVVERDGMTCQYCGRTVVETMDQQRTDMFTLDHVVSRSRGGKNTVENLVVACRTCNGEKSDLPVDSFNPRPYVEPGRPHHRPCRRCHGVHLPHAREPCWPVSRDPDDDLLFGKRVAASLHAENVGPLSKRRQHIRVRATAALKRAASA